MDREAWWALVHGVPNSWTRLTTQKIEHGGTLKIVYTKEDRMSLRLRGGANLREWFLPVNRRELENRII